LVHWNELDNKTRLNPYKTRERPYIEMIPDAIFATVPAYGSIINMVLLFADGALFGLAVKKGLISIVLLAVALVLAGYLGLSIPFLTPSLIATHLVNILASVYKSVGPAFFAFPILFILGFALALWKG